MTPEMAINLAQEHLVAGRIPAAEQIAREVLAQVPGYSPAMAVLGVAAFTNGRLEDALGHFQTVVSGTTSPTAGELHRVGECLRHLARPEEAIPWLERAVAGQPDMADYHVSLALALLTLDRYEEGFEHFEWRWRSTRLNTQRINFDQPTWDGGDAKGKTILVWAEQGLGDVIHAIRYAKPMADRGARVVVGCQEPLARLLNGASGVTFATSKFQETPAFDLQIPSFSLMRALRTTYDTIPSGVPYIKPDPAIVQQWKARLANDPAKHKVGLVWAGSPTNPTDSQRSIAPTALAPLAGVKEVSFYSLQIEQQPGAVSFAPTGMQIRSAGHLLTNFAETAGLLMNLDLLISVDTAPVHLAGALGRPVWVLLANMNDWRWGLARTDTRWYPTARLFRQPRRGDWNSVMQEVAATLATL